MLELHCLQWEDSVHGVFSGLRHRRLCCEIFVFLRGVEASACLLIAVVISILGLRLRVLNAREIHLIFLAVVVLGSGVKHNVFLLRLCEKGTEDLEKRIGGTYH